VRQRTDPPVFLRYSIEQTPVHNRKRSGTRCEQTFATKAPYRPALGVAPSRSGRTFDRAHVKEGSLCKYFAG
jgi:hypothetical protein